MALLLFPGPKPIARAMINSGVIYGVNESFNFFILAMCLSGWNVVSSLTPSFSKKSFNYEDVIQSVTHWEENLTLQFNVTSTFLRVFALSGNKSAPTVLLCCHMIKFCAYCYVILKFYQLAVWRIPRGLEFKFIYSLILPKMYIW